MFNSVIFDIDGTLLDSSKGIIAAVNYTIEKLNLNKLSEKELREFVAYSPLKKAFMHYCKVEDKVSIECCETYRKHYKEKTMFMSDIYENIIELLEFLKTNNYNLGIATFKNEENAKLLLKNLNLDKYFDFISGAQYEKSETKADILVRCLKNLNADSDKTIFIGDSHSDAIAAQESNCNFIGVTYGFGFSDSTDIEQYKPLKIANTVQEITDFIRENK